MSSESRLCVMYRSTYACQRRANYISRPNRACFDVLTCIQDHFKCSLTNKKNSNYCTSSIACLRGPAGETTMSTDWLLLVFGGGGVGGSAWLDLGRLRAGASWRQVALARDAVTALDVADGARTEFFLGERPDVEVGVAGRLARVLQLLSVPVHQTHHTLRVPAFATR